MKRINLIIQTLGSILVLIGVILHLSQNEFGKYLFASGAFFLFITAIINSVVTKKESFRVKRTVATMFLLSVAMLLGAYFMFVGNSYWFAIVVIYALVSLFLSFRK